MVRIHKKSHSFFQKGLKSQCMLTLSEILCPFNIFWGYLYRWLEFCNTRILFFLALLVKPITILDKSYLPTTAPCVNPLYSTSSILYIGMPLGAFLVSRLNPSRDDPQNDPSIVLVWRVNIKKATPRKVSTPILNGTPERHPRAFLMKSTFCSEIWNENKY